MPSRFDTPVNVQIEGAGRKYLKQALQLMDIVNRQRTLAGITMFKGFQSFGPTAYAFAISIGGTSIVRVVADEEEEVDHGVTITKYPDFVSGVVTDGRLIKVADEANNWKETTYVQGFRPTIQCSALFHLNGPVVQRLHKLAVELYIVHEDLVTPDPFSPIRYTQYAKLHPTMWSGSMRKLVQLLMGFGHQAKKSIYGFVARSNDDEDGSVVFENKKPTQYELEVKKNGRQIRYDYRFPRTHGLTRATDGSWWLVEIGINRGVAAMPVLVHEETTTARFRQKVIELNDLAGLEALDMFGGFPDGQTFPTHLGTFAAWKRAGRIVELAPVSSLDDFYLHHTAYSSMMGWCFNEEGSEAHNTGYRFDPDDGFQRGVHYAINLKLTTTIPVTADPRAVQLKAQFQQIKSDGENIITFAANMFKLDRLPSSDIDTITGLLSHGNELQSAYDALDALIAPPMATGSSVPRKVGEGKIFWPSKIQPEIKFPEPLLGYLVSHDMRGDERKIFGPVPYCDTTMHVCFIQNRLRVCKFFSGKSDSSTATRREGDDPYEITWSPIGEFHETYTTGPFGVPAMFYTTDFDDRHESGALTETHVYRRYDKGFIGGQTSFRGLDGPIDINNPESLVPDFPEGGVDENHKLQIHRVKWFEYHAWTTRTQFQNQIGAIAVPMYDRSSYYYATMEGHFGSTDVYTYRAGLLSSPWHGHFYRVLVITCGRQNILGSNLLTPEPQYNAAGGPYGDYKYIADDGDWVPHCSPVQSVPSAEPAIAAVKSITKYIPTDHPARRTLTVWHASDAVDGVKKTYTETRTGTDASLWESLWFLPSPDRDAGVIVAYLYSTSSTFNLPGIMSAVYDKTINSLLPPFIDGPIQGAYMNAGVCYVGVIGA